MGRMTTVKLSGPWKKQGWRYVDSGRTRGGVRLEIVNREARPGVRARYVAVAVSEREEIGAIDERGYGIVIEVREKRYRELGKVGTSSACVFARGVESRLIAAVWNGPRSGSLVSFDAARGAEVKRVATQRIASLDAHNEEIASTSPESVEIRDARDLTRTRHLPRRHGSADFVSARFVDASRADDGARLCVLSADGSLILYASHTLDAAERLVDDNGARCFSAKPGGFRLVAGSNRVVRLWDVSLERPDRDSKDLEGRTIALEWHRSDEILRLDDDGRLVAHSADAFEPRYRVRVPAAYAFACGDDTAAVATNDGSLLYVDLGVARRADAPAQKRKKKIVAVVPNAGGETPPPLHRITRLESGRNTWLTPARLRALLAEHGEYPARHRALVWRMLLGLAENDSAYAALVDESPADVAADVPPLTDSREQARLGRVVRALAAWCEPLADAEWLAAAAYPVVAVFEADEACAFETLVTFLAKFARSWLSCWPEPPLPALYATHELCEACAPQTAKILAVNLGLEPKDWAWPMMRSLFSEVLPTAAWLRLWDAVVSAGPARGGRLLALAPVAFAATQAAAVAACVSRGEALALVRRPLGAAAARGLVAKTQRLEASLDARLRRLADGVPSEEGRAGLVAIAEDALDRARAFPFPLDKAKNEACYPAMSAYPLIAKDLARRERERVALEAARSKARRELEASTERAAREAMEASRRLAASEAAAKIAEEAALRRTETAEARRAELEAAAHAGAERCDIYTDVDGVYSTDPRIEGSARRIERIAYEEMLELASLGAKVLQTRSVELAMRYDVPIQVLSSFEDAIGSDLPGTIVCAEREILARAGLGAPDAGEASVESKVVSGVAFSREEAKITLQRVADRPGVAASIFGPLSKAGVNVDMIVQNVSEDGQTDMTFTVSLAEYERALSVIEEARAAIGYSDVVADRDVAKVSIVGIGMRSHVGVAQTMFQALANEGVNIQVITTSEIKVSVLIERKYLELAVRALHAAFSLDET